MGPLPLQPKGLPFPTDAWPTAGLGGAAGARVEEAASFVFSDAGAAAFGPTFSLLVLQGGRLLFERYGEGVSPDTPLPSWSMAKSVTHALCGLLVRDGRLDPARPAPVPEWSGPADPRSAILLDHLLTMTSGLKFTEVYLPDQGSDVVEMLFGRGKADTGAFAASFPLERPPGERFAYSSGTTNIIARCLGTLVGGSEAGFRAFMTERLFAPLGMRSPKPRFDAAGTFIGSSFCDASARDFARFGLLYLRDGIWEDRRLLPEGWCDRARAATAASRSGAEGPYGAQFWVDQWGPGSFSANGYEGQRLILIPDHDLIVVRNGKTPLDQEPDLSKFLSELIEDLRRTL